MAVFMKTSVLLPHGALGLPLVCDKCNAEVLLVSPVRIQDLVAITGAFSEKHKGCGDEATEEEDSI